MKTEKDIEDICRKLKPIIGNQAEQLWYLYLAEDDKGRRALTLDIELIAEKFLKKDPLSNQAILLNPPSQTDVSGSFLIGDVIYNDKNHYPLYLRHEDFIKQIGIFAVTGEGKTNLAYLLALQLLKSHTPFMVIDWKRSWRNLLSLQDLQNKIPELKEIQVYTIGRDVLPFLWNPFRPPPNCDKEQWISTIAEALEKSHISGPGVAYYFNKIYSKLFKSFNKNSSNGFYPNFYDGLREIETIRATDRELRWKQTALRIFQTFTLGSASKAFNTRKPIKLEQLFNKPVILELDLEMPKPLRIFFSELILRWIHLYRLSEGETKKLKHVLFLEEAHNLFKDARNYYHKEADSLENIYREIRAFGQGLVSITKHPSMLPVYLLGNCHTQVYLGLQHADDIRTARKSLFLKYDEESYPNMLKVGECIVKIKNRIEPCLVKIPLVPVKNGIITDNWLKSVRVNTTGYLLSSNDFNPQHNPGYLPGDNIEEEEKGKYHKDNLNSNSYRLLVDIFENPLSSITQRYKTLKLNPKYGNKFKNFLISQGLIQPRKIITNKGWITLFDLTHKGKAVLRDHGHDIKDTREGITHRFWKYKIADYYKNKNENLKVLIEENINGRPDIIISDDSNSKNKKAAIEIETGNSYALANIQKCLNAGFNEIICVATNRQLEEKIRLELKKKGIINNKVKVTSVFGFGVG